MRIRRLILCLGVTLAVTGVVYTPRAAAFDPSMTPLVLGPFAVKAAKVATPYVIKGLKGGLNGFLKMGGDVLDILKLPIGLMGCSIGAPFGYFRGGVKWVTEGAIAPFKLAFHAVMLPVFFSGIDVP